MTATMQRPPRPAGARAPAPEPPRADRSGARRTLLALLATALGAMPLKSLLSDNTWLVDGWLTMLVVIVPAVLLRLRRPPGALDIWPGIILLVPWLTALFVRDHAVAGLIPTGATLDDVSRLMDDLHHTTSSEVAPIHSTVAVRLVVCALLGLLAALVDLIAVVGRRAALAGVPLLVVYTISGAVPRSPVAWGWFAVAATGYLVLLGLDAGDQVRRWGRRIARDDAPGTRPRLTLSAQRIGAAAVVVAIAVPLLVPSHPRNLLADAFHDHHTSTGLGGFGAGGGAGSISPFASLKGELDRDKPVPVMSVHVSEADTTPFYVRSNVLDRFTGDGWTVSDHGDTRPISGNFDTDLATNALTSTFTADITISNLTGNAPVFAQPDAISGLDGGTTWSTRDGILLGAHVKRGQHFTERVAQPAPDQQQLAASPPAEGPDFDRYLALPDLPAEVGQTVARITRGKDTPYARARALSDWFADPANGFIYSLKTQRGDSGSDLVDFLRNRAGFCQQYAAALGVMLRLAGVPARVVLGYMHSPVDRQGNFVVTTFDAHAWVEAYFPDQGWIPFDPTPVAGLSGGRQSDLSWAPHQYPSDSGPQVPSRTASSSASRQLRGSTSAAASSAPAIAQGPGRSSSDGLGLLAGVLVAILVALSPALARALRRRRRLAAARRGDAEALWSELSDTAVDLGYVWSDARSPRQVSAWLARDAAPRAATLETLAAAVERRRYAPTAGGAGADGAALVRDLQQVTGALRARRSSRNRLLATLWPASLGWGRRLGSLTAVPRRARR